MTDIDDAIERAESGELEPDKLCFDGKSHDWQPVWSINMAGRAYRCEKCWDRTD